MPRPEQIIQDIIGEQLWELEEERTLAGPIMWFTGIIGLILAIVLPLVIR